MIGFTVPMAAQWLDPAEAASPCAAQVVFLHQDDLSSQFANWEPALAATLQRLADDGELRGRATEVVLLHTPPGLPARRLVCVGVGSLLDLDADRLRQASARATRRLRAARITDFQVLLPAAWHDRVPPGDMAQAIVEGALLAAYRFGEYRSANTDADALPAGTLTLVPGAATADETNTEREGLGRGVAVGEATCFARDLCSHPGNALTPQRFVEVALRIAAEEGLHAERHDVAALRSLGMGGLLGVAAGSREPPCLLELLYTPPGTEHTPPLVLVGKTVTFDSGGISLKSALDMDHMKADMGGGAAVLAALRAAARLRLPQRIVALLPVVENMPGGGAMRPGDILRMASGTTVEVLNTDAEGRLILADALHHARRHAPACVIDIATLTGASAVVFGPFFTGMFSTAPAHAHAMEEAGLFSGEKTWPMPLAAEYREMLRGQTADLRNIAGTLGAMPLGAAFLQHFTQGTPWLHLDIYNSCWHQGDHPCLPQGATGSGTRLLTQFLLRGAPAAP